MKRALFLLMVLLVASCSGGSKVNEKVESLPDFDAWWDYGDAAGTEAKFTELLPRAKQSGDQSYYAQLLTQIARTQGLQRRFKDAHETLDTVLAMLSDEMVTAKVRYLLERGRVYNSSGEREKSKPLFLEAWELGVANQKDFYAVDAAHMLGIVEPPEKQLEWNGKAIELAEKSANPRAKNWLGSLYNNTGWSYHDLKQYDRALGMFEKALKFQQEKSDQEGIRIAKWTIARTYRSLDRIEEALRIQKELEREIEEKGIQQDGYVFEEIGECLLLLNQQEESRQYFNRAYQLLSQDPWLVANEPERLERLKKLGDVKE
jgi:tetratricopeptide (TPR) repeat protein